MDRVELLAYLRRATYAVEASVSPKGGPQAAVVGVAVGDDLAVVFDTLGTTRKARNLRLDPRVAFVFFDDACTVQLEGTADEPHGDELASAKAIYFAKFPDGREREAWPGITYFRARPTWIRFSDFRGETPYVEEWDEHALRALRNA
jgi:hypothetical protein